MTESVVSERFFRRRGETPFSSDDGFLPDPGTATRRDSARTTIRIEDAANVPCLVVLGEPGIGKSTTMRRRQMSLSPRACFVDLKAFEEAAFLASPAVGAWKEGAQPLDLLVDGVELDVGAAYRIANQLSVGPKHSLHLEMACRASDWPAGLEEILLRIFGKSGVSIVFIEPLRRIDAAQIAAKHGVDAEQFLQEVVERRLGPLAAIPITLQLLLLLFASKRSLPGSRSDVYSQACQTLCMEPDVDRKTSRDTDMLLDVAALVAALTVFSNRWVISDTPLLTERPGQLTIDHIAKVARPLGIARPTIRDALKTALFTPTESSSWGWYHQTLGEHLAARWLASKELSPIQLQQLLFHPEDSEYLVPQLTSVASWLADTNSYIAALIATHAPEHFVASDARNASASSRHEAVDALLKHAERYALSKYWWRPEDLQKLSHPTLANQLEPWLQPGPAAHLALQIVAANRLQALTQSLCLLAENRSAEPDVRAHAIRSAIASTADRNATLDRLRHLVEPGDTSDPYEEVRTAILNELWPNHLSKGDLFRLLTRPLNVHYFGAYQQFLIQLPDRLRPEDIDDALAWVIEQNPGNRPHDSVTLEKLSSAICTRALASIGSAGTRKLLARAALTIIRSYCSPFKDPVNPGEPYLFRDEALRRTTVTAIAEITDDPKGDAYHMVHPHDQPPFVSEADIGWILDQWRYTKCLLERDLSVVRPPADHGAHIGRRA